MPLKCPLKSLSRRRTFQWHIYMASKASFLTNIYFPTIGTLKCLLGCFPMTIIGKLSSQSFHCKNMRVISTNFSYVSCNEHSIALYFETQKLLGAMKIVLCMPVEYPLNQLLQECTTRFLCSTTSWFCGKQSELSYLYTIYTINNIYSGQLE